MQTVANPIIKDLLNHVASAIKSTGAKVFGKDAMQECLERLSNKPATFTYARTADNGYEVSSQGDKRFSALHAKFAPGTKIEGVDVGGMTIEDVYQKIIKKSSKGKAPAEKSNAKVNFISSEDKGVTTTTFQSYRKGRPLKIALPIDKSFIVEKSLIEEGDTVNVLEVRKGKDNAGLELYAGTIEVIGKDGVKTSYRVSFEEDPLAELNKRETLEEHSYKWYKHLWKEWAKQNPELIAELRQKAQGKTLTDKFANTRVSQARALADILNETQPNHSLSEAEIQKLLAGSQLEFAHGINKPKGVEKYLLSSAIMTQANTFEHLTDKLKNDDGSVEKKSNFLW